MGGGNRSYSAESNGKSLGLYSTKKEAVTVIADDYNRKMDRLTPKSNPSDIELTIGKSYILYGKTSYMKKYKPVAGSDFVENLIRAEILSPQSSNDIEKMKRELDFLKDQGSFEYRPIKGKNNPARKKPKSVVNKKRSGKLRTSTQTGANTMATRKRKARRTPAQKRASLRNIKKAQAARRRKGRRKPAKRRVKRRVAKRKPAKRRVKRRVAKRKPAKRRTAKKRTTKRKGPKKAHKGERKGQHVKRGGRFYVVAAGRLLRKSSASAAKRAKASKRRKR